MLETSLVDVWTFAMSPVTQISLNSYLFAIGVTVILNVTEEQFDFDHLLGIERKQRQARRTSEIALQVHRKFQALNTVSRRYTGRIHNLPLDCVRSCNVA